MKTKKKRKAAKKPKSFKPKQELQATKEKLLDKFYDELAETTGESKSTTTFIEYHRRAYGQ